MRGGIANQVEIAPSAWLHTRSRSGVMRGAMRGAVRGAAATGIYKRTQPTEHAKHTHATHACMDALELVAPPPPQSLTPSDPNLQFHLGRPASPPPVLCPPAPGPFAAIDFDALEHDLDNCDLLRAMQTYDANKSASEPPAKKVIAPPPGKYDALRRSSIFAPKQRPQPRQPTAQSDEAITTLDTLNQPKSTLAVASGSVQTEPEPMDVDPKPTWSPPAWMLPGQRQACARQESSKDLGAPLKMLTYSAKPTKNPKALKAPKASVDADSNNAKNREAKYVTDDWSDTRVNQVDRFLTEFYERNILPDPSMVTQANTLCSMAAAEVIGSEQKHLASAGFWAAVFAQEAYARCSREGYQVGSEAAREKWKMESLERIVLQVHGKHSFNGEKARSELDDFLKARQQDFVKRRYLNSHYFGNHSDMLKKLDKIDIILKRAGDKGLDNLVKKAIPPHVVDFEEGRQKSEMYQQKQAIVSKWGKQAKQQRLGH